MNWYVQVQHQNYGPYSDEQMGGFTKEGRIEAGALITSDINAGFYRADSFDAFKYWQGQYQAPAIQGQQIPQPAPQPEAPTTQRATQQATPSDISTNIYLVMAEIKSGASMGFLQVLQSFGQPQRIGDTVWLLRCYSPVENLRNHLSQTLSSEDRLFILDSSNNKPAWFNIGADLDHRVRELWDEDEQENTKQA